jgi:hypothetical protein
MTPSLDYSRFTANTYTMNTDSWERRAETTWLEADLDRDWRMSCRVVRQGETLVIAEVQIVAKGDSVPMGGVDSVVLRRAGVGGVLRAAKELGIGTGLFREATNPDAVRKYLQSGKRRDTPAKYAAIALLYDQARRDGHLKVAQVVAEATGLPYKTVTHYAVQARKYEPPLLWSRGQGRTGAEATDEARRIAAGWWFAFAPAATATATAYSATVKTEDGTGSRTHSRTH